MGRISELAENIRSFLSRRQPVAKAAAKALGPLEVRRTLLNDADLGIDEVLKAGDLGIAFSGGGIRSATICLGITQSLVEEERLLDFDYCSTVSGGGYFGSFLTSLFLPDRARELANTLGGVAVVTRDAGSQYHNRAAYIGSWAMMVKAAAEGPPQIN